MKQELTKWIVDFNVGYSDKAIKIKIETIVQDAPGRKIATRYSDKAIKIKIETTRLLPGRTSR